MSSTTFPISIDALWKVSDCIATSSDNHSPQSCKKRQRIVDAPESITQTRFFPLTTPGPSAPCTHHAALGKATNIIKHHLHPGQSLLSRQLCCSPVNYFFILFVVLLCPASASITFHFSKGILIHQKHSILSTALGK